MAAPLQQFKSTLVYEAQAPKEQLLADLQAIRDFDKQAERLLTVYTIIIITSIAVGIGGFLYKSPIAIGLAVAGLILGIGLRIMGAGYDLANRRFELLGELVNILSRDMSKDAAFSVKLDLAKANHNRKKVGKGTAGAWSVTYYVDPWLQLGGKFADGTAFQIAMTERYQARSKWKTSRSGKAKHKSKTKIATCTSVRLCPKLKRYENVGQAVDQAENLLRLPEWASVKKLNATPEELALTTITGADWAVRRHKPGTSHDGVELVARMLLSLYQVLHVSNAPPKRA